MGDCDSEKTLENRSQRAKTGMVASHLLQGIIKLVIDMLASCWSLLGRVLCCARVATKLRHAAAFRFRFSQFCNYRHTHSSRSSKSSSITSLPTFSRSNYSPFLVSCLQFEWTPHSEESGSRITLLMRPMAMMEMFPAIKLQSRLSPARSRIQIHPCYLLPLPVHEQQSPLTSNSKTRPHLRKTISCHKRYP